MSPAAGPARLAFRGSSVEDLVQYVVDLRDAVKDYRWLLGDAVIAWIWMHDGDHDSVGSLASRAGVSKAEMLRAARVSASFPPERNQEGEEVGVRSSLDLSYQHYATVAGEKDAIPMLEMAHDENLSQYQLARVVKGLPERQPPDPNEEHKCRICGLAHTAAGS